MENSINIIHEVTSYKNRIKHNVLLFIGAVSFCGVLSFISDKNLNGLYLLSLSIIFGILIFYRILKTRHYLADFISDSTNVKIVYFNGSKQEEFETSMNNIDVELKNTTSRAGFNCELILYIEELKFTVNKEFDWNFSEMIQLFKYIKFHQNVTLVENEKDMISNMEEYLKRYPF